MSRPFNGCCRTVQSKAPSMPRRDMPLPTAQPSIIHEQNDRMPSVGTCRAKKASGVLRKCARGWHGGKRQSAVAIKYFAAALWTNSRHCQGILRAPNAHAQEQLSRACRRWGTTGSPDSNFEGQASEICDAVDKAFYDDRLQNCVFAGSLFMPRTREPMRGCARLGKSLT
jgi:hypothetical protein